MLLQQTMRATGEALFRWRSFAPMIFVPLVVLSMRRDEPIERLLGDAWGDAYETGCIVLVGAGLALRAATVGFVPAGTSGRNTKEQAASVLNTKGLYSLTRNPLYFANCLIYLGVVLFTQDMLLGLAFALFLALYYERIILAEEAFLVARFGDAYHSWAAEVPAFMPRLSGWIPPALPFCARTVLRREYPGWGGAVVALALVDIGGDFLSVDGETVVDDGWLIAATAAVGIVLTLRLLKRHSAY